MTWVKLDDGFPEHPKVLGLSDAAFRLHVVAICYAARNLTDGVIPRVWLKDAKATLKIAVQQLVAARLWSEHADGWAVHDYLTYQQSRTQVEESRERNNSRVKRHRNALQKRDGNGSETLPRIDPIREDRTKEIDPTTSIPSVPEQLPASSPLIVSPIQFEKAKKSFAFFGSRLKVPHVLHVELRDKLGGENPEAQLQAWYLAVNSEAEESRLPIVDVFEFVRPRFKEWAADAVATAELERFRPKGA